ncbi:hypothetical protein KJ980_01990 [Patescibacteria group bacterium]|nr:hypothetical protein [Patescibacteria group bacterium]MBU4098400.1 hypothetical protein [Patescibacteria group bacterium]
MKYKDVISQFNINLKDAVKRDPSLKEQDGFILSDIKGSISLIIQENKINESKDYMLKKGITGLIINMSLGYTKLDVDFLSDFNFIEYLNIVHQPLGDTKAINSLHGLKSLVLYAYFFTEIDFNNFSNLQECSILHWTPNAKNLFNCTKLKKLYLRSYKKKDLSELENLKLLEELRVDNSPIKSLKGLSELKSIKELDFGGLTKLTDIDEIKELPLLNKLNIQSCKKIPFEKLWQLKNLKWLNLSDIGNIPTIKGIEQLNMLEEVYMVGDTKILDGDTSPLLKLANIKKVGLAHLSHYKPTTLEIQAKIEGKDLKTLLQEYSHMRIYNKMLKEINIRNKFKR